MEKMIIFFSNVKRASFTIAMALIGVILVLCLLDIAVPTVNIGVLKTVVSTFKGLISAGTQVGLSGLVVLAIVAIVFKK